MSQARTLDLIEVARRGRLYPSVILHGSTIEGRRELALQLARCLLCERPVDERPCESIGDRCTHCRRISDAGSEENLFHPDFQILERDLKTSTSVDATKQFLRTAQVAPFEARGQVFVIADAASLSGGAANALLKTLEEPYETSPRNFLLLASSRQDLLPTLRSRSLSFYLGPGEAMDREAGRELASTFAAAVTSFLRDGAPIWLLAAAQTLIAGADWTDPRASGPWNRAARAIVDSRDEVDERASRELLSLAQELLRSAPYRLRGISAERILEGLVARYLAPLAPARR